MRRRRPLGTVGLAVVLLGLLLATRAEARDWGWLGVRIRELSEMEMEEISARHGIREGYGVVVVAVLEGSPAARSSMRAGDIVVGFAGRPIVDSRTLQRLIGTAPLDRDLPLTVLRRGEGRRELSVRLAPMPPEIVGERVAAEFGFFLHEVLTEKDAANWLGPTESLSVVADVLSGSLAERGGLQPGDVLREINDQRLLSFRDATQALARARLDQPLRLVVRRGGDDQLSLTLPHPAAP